MTSLAMTPSLHLDDLDADSSLTPRVNLNNAVDIV
jgi:hypothetical protein